MPHRKNPAEGHNPFGVVGNRATTTTTTTRPRPARKGAVTNGQFVPRIRQPRKSARSPGSKGLRSGKVKARKSRRTKRRSQPRSSRRPRR